MTESEAREVLRAQGIHRPSQQLVQDYMRANSAQEWALELPPTEVEQVPPRGTNPPRPESSKSNLKPVLRAAGQLERPRGPRKPGRPPVIASYFGKLALIMSDGTPLREALGRCGIDGITPRLLRSLYRNTVLSRLRREAREKWQREYGVRPRSKGLRELLRGL